MALGLAAAIGLGTGALQSGLGVLDMFRGRKERRAAESFLAKNKYEIPSAARASLQTAERMASGVGLPAQDLMESRLAATTAQGVGAMQGAARSSSDVLGGLSSLFGQQMMAQQGISIEAANQFQENQRQLQRAQQMFGEEQRQEWNQNVLMPYQQRMERAAQYSQRGREGLSAGLSGLASTGAGMMQMKGAQNRLNQYMDYLGGGNTSSPMSNNITSGMQPYRGITLGQ